MDLDRALAQISEIHTHVLRAAVFRECRALPVLVTGALALVFAGIQEAVIRPPAPEAFAFQWIGVAVLAGTIIGLDLLRAAAADEAAARRVRTVAGQIAPSLAAGALLTGVLLRGPTPLAGLLPGMWSVILGLGLFAARPYLPRAIGWVGLWYLGTGAVLLAAADPAGTPSPWAMAAAFGGGQAGSALVLHRNRERLAS